MSILSQYQSSLTFQEYHCDIVQQYLYRFLPERRYNHVLRVLDTALDLADKVGLSSLDKERLTKAVLFHDFAKGMTTDELKEYASIHKIDLLNSLPPIYHAIIGAWMAQHFFGIEDIDILNAIYYHTTGNIGFLSNSIGALLFLADFLEPGRKGDHRYVLQFIPDYISQALLETIKSKICHILQKSQLIDEWSISFYQTLVSYNKNNK